MNRRLKWKKILYKTQPYPDNFVDKSFLRQLEKNRHIQNLDLSQIFAMTGIISQQMSSVFIFVAMFAYMQTKFLSPYLLIGVSSSLTASGYLTINLDANTSIDTNMNRSYLNGVKSTLLLAGFVFGFSSVLRTLTYTICSDTVYTMATLMLICHLVFHGYGYCQADNVYSPVSVNASVFASVCLASRLPTLEHTFVTILFSFQIFSLLPVLRNRHQKNCSNHRNVFTSLIFLTCLLCLYPIGADFTILFLSLQFCIIFLCPLWLHRLQIFKDNIHGPWDEAVIADEKRPIISSGLY